jgi:hypothetical protein
MMSRPLFDLYEEAPEEENDEEEDVVGTRGRLSSLLTARSDDDDDEDAKVPTCSRDPLFLRRLLPRRRAWWCSPMGTVPELKESTSCACSPPPRPWSWSSIRFVFSF